MTIKLGRIRDHWANFIGQFAFQWFVSLTFKNPVRQELGRKKILRWVRQLCVEEGLQIAFIGVENEFYHRAHWHLLMLGRNRFGRNRNLSSVDKEKWARRWWEANCGRWIKVKKGALIKGVRKTTDENKYLAKNLVVENPDASDIFIYNKKLLKKLRRESPVLPKENGTTSRGI
jgi:hypothetical protein